MLGLIVKICKRSVHIGIDFLHKVDLLLLLNDVQTEFKEPLEVCFRVWNYNTCLWFWLSSVSSHCIALFKCFVWFCVLEVCFCFTIFVCLQGLSLKFSFTIWVKSAIEFTVMVVNFGKRFKMLKIIENFFLFLFSFVLLDGFKQRLRIDIFYVDLLLYFIFLFFRWIGLWFSLRWNFLLF